MEKSSEPFFLGCEATPPPSRVHGNWTARPDGEKPDALYSDVPFALGIPAIVRHEGGVSRISYRVTVEWDNAPEDWIKNSRFFVPTDCGLYNADNKSLPDGSVFFNDYGHATTSNRWTKLSLDKDAKVPTWSTRGGLRIEMDRNHEPFAKGSTWDSFVLAPSVPGRYVVWLAVDLLSDWPAKEPKREDLRGKFHVDVLVTRTERPARDEEIAWLFGRKKERPADMPDDKFFLAGTYELPFTVKRDAWVFHHSEVVPLRDSVKQPKTQFAKYSTETNTEVTSSVQAGGPAVGLEFQSQTWEGALRGTDDKGKPIPMIYQENDQWTINLPKEIPDYSFTTMTATGKKVKHFNPGRYTTVPENQAGPSGNSTFSECDWLPEAESQAETGRSARVWFCWHTDKDLYRDSSADQRKYFVDQFGEDMQQWWFEDYRKNTFDGPTGGGQAFRFVVNGVPPAADDGVRTLTITETNSYPALAYNVGPWRVVGYYTRLGNSKRGGGATPTIGEATFVEDRDDFWKWYITLARVLAEQIPKAMAAQVEAMQESVPLQQLIKSRDHLMLSLQNETAAAEGAGRWFSQGIEDAAAAVDSGTRGILPGGGKLGTRNTPATVGGMDSAAIRTEKLQEITAEIGEHRQTIMQDTTTARAAYDVIVKKLEEGKERYGGPNHPELLLWLKKYRHDYEHIPVELAVASNDPEILKKLLDESALYAESADARIMEAQLYRAQGDAISALVALRRAVRIDPENEDARNTLTSLECAFLQRAIDKSQGAIADARRHFYGYLMERGFADRDILANQKMPLNWLATRIGVYGEEAWAVFTTGIFGSFSAFYGKPAAEADLLATTERQMTTAFIGLHTMRLLRKKDVSFVEMSTNTSQQMCQKLDMRDRKGNPLSDPEAANIGVAVREAMKLPDVQALMGEDRQALEDGIKQGYWDSKDVCNTWIEWFGDLTSVYNLATLLLPAAKVGTAGRTSGLMWTKAEMAMMHDLQALGTIKSGTEAVATAVGLTRALNAAGATERGQKLVNFLVRMEKYQAGLGKLDKAVWTVGKLTGALTFGYVTVSATEHLVGHKAAMIVQAALLFATDTELLTKLLKGRNIPPKAVAAVITGEFIPATKDHIKRLTLVEGNAEQMNTIFARLKTGGQLSKGDIEFLHTLVGDNYRLLIPSANAGENATIAMLASSEGALSGVNNGAIDAVTTLKPELEFEASAAAQTLQDEVKVADALNQAATDGTAPIPPPAVDEASAAVTDNSFETVNPAPPPPPERPRTATGPSPQREKPTTAQVGGPQPDRPITNNKLGPLKPKAEPRPRKPLDRPEYPPSEARVLPEEARPPREWGGYEVYPDMREGSRSARAERMLHQAKTREDFEKVQRVYEGILNDLRDGVIVEADEMAIERLHVRRMLAHELQTATRKFPTGRSPINNPIAAETVDAIFAGREALIKRESSGVMAEMFNVPGHDDLIVKKIRAEFDVTINGKLEHRSIDILEDIQNNVVHTELARACGFDVPTMEARIIYDQSGRAVEAYYVMRKVVGKSMDQLTAAEIFLYREEWARHRALSVLIGDFDRKLDNYIITEEGHFVPIDAGCADVTGENMVRECAKEGIPYEPAMPFTIDGCWGRDHWYAKNINAAPGKELLTYKKTLMRKCLIADEAMTFQAAEPVILEIENLFVNGTKAAEAEKIITEAYVKTELQSRVNRMAELKGANLADPAVRAALEQEARLSLAAKFKEKIDLALPNLKARAPKIRDCMKHCHNRNGLPIIESIEHTPDHSSLQIDDDFLIRFTMLHYLNRLPQRKAA